MGSTPTPTSRAATATRPPAASGASRRRSPSPATAARPTSAASCTRPSRKRRPDHRRGRRHVRRLLRQVADTAAPQRHHPRPRGGQPLPVERAQHRLAGGRDVPAHRRGEREGASRRLPHEHRGIGPGAGDRRDRRNSAISTPATGIAATWAPARSTFRPSSARWCACGYPGRSLQVVLLSGRRPAAEGILGIWRNLWEDSGDLASHALLYTRAQLKAAQEVQRQAARSRLP